MTSDPRPESGARGSRAFTVVLWVVAGLEGLGALADPWSTTRLALFSLVVFGALVMVFRWVFLDEHDGWIRLGALGLIAFVAAWQGHQLQAVRRSDVTLWVAPVLAFLVGVIVACRPPGGARLWLSLLGLAALASPPITMAANGVFDDGVANVYKTTVTRSDYSTRDQQYEVTVAPWEGLRAPIELDLDREVSSRLHGATGVEVHVKPGWLGIEWIDDVRTSP